jgi:hypothetical protein
MSQPHHALLLQHKGRVQPALQACISGQFKSHQAAAHAFNVKHHILSKRVKEISFHAETPPNGLRLTSTKEQTIVQYILDLDLQGFAP